MDDLAVPQSPYHLAVAVVPTADRYIVTATLNGVDQQARLEASTQIRLSGERYLAEIVANFVRVLRAWETAIAQAGIAPRALPAYPAADDLARLAALHRPEVPRTISLRFYPDTLAADWRTTGR